MNAEKTAESIVPNKISCDWVWQTKSAHQHLQPHPSRIFVIKFKPRSYAGHKHNKISTKVGRIGLAKTVCFYSEVLARLAASRNDNTESVLL